MAKHTNGDEEVINDRATESDWLFDYIDGVLKSPSYDSEIMSFIDEYCVIFDNEEENKFEHSMIHDKFCEIVENLLTGHLENVTITPEEFAKACEKARYASRSNKKIFEQLISLTDFLSFKKLMVKRNMELELEAVKELHEKAIPLSAPINSEEAERLFQIALKESAEMSHADAEKILENERKLKEEEANIAKIQEEEEDTSKKKKLKSDTELRLAMDLNLIELEYQNRKLELEQLELEQALAMSMFMEEERLRLARSQQEEYDKAQRSSGEDDDDDDDDDDDESSEGTPTVAETKEDYTTNQESKQYQQALMDLERHRAEPQHGAQSEELQRAKAELERHRAEVASLSQHSGAQSEELQQAKAELERHRAEVASLSQHSGAQSEELQRAKAELERHRAEVASLSQHSGAQSEELQQAKAELERHRARIPSVLRTGSPSRHVAQEGLDDVSDWFDLTSLPAQSEPKVLQSSHQTSSAEVEPEFWDQSLHPDSSGARIVVKEKKKKKKKKKHSHYDAPAGGEDEEREVFASSSTSVSSLGPLVSQRGLVLVTPLPSAEELHQQMQTRRREAEEVYHVNQETLSKQRETEKELAKVAGVTKKDEERRAAHLKEQRDLIIAKKRAERERKAKEYEAEKELKFAAMASSSIGSGAEEKELTDDDKRHMLRAMLGRDFKRDLEQEEAERLRVLQQQQEDELHHQLRTVGSLREENSVRERELKEKITAQQEEMFRNLQSTVAREIIENS